MKRGGRRGGPPFGPPWGRPHWGRHHWGPEDRGPNGWRDRRHRRVSSRLYKQIYRAVLATSLVGCLIAAGLAHFLHAHFGNVPPPVAIGGGTYGLRFLFVLMPLVGLMALAMYPVARRVTRRLEILQEGVERFGAGDLSQRVEVVGHDEVASLATVFNAAAERIETLVQQQKRLLASASHELRAPLARLRMAHELLLDADASMDAEARQKMLVDVEGDINELDALVADVLLAARLEQPKPLDELETVELSALCLGAAERAQAQSDVHPGVFIDGDAAMLSRLLRNLLDNAKNYGAGGAEAPLVELTLDDGGPVLRVSDRGPVVAEEDRERIFEAFYRPQGHAETRDGGVGLGLSLVRQIAERHGAHVQHRPRDGGGSHFEVLFGTV